MLKESLDKNINQIYDLTNLIKNLEIRVSKNEDNVKLKTKLVTLLLAYETIRKDTLELLDEYFKQETARTNVATFNYHLLRKKLTD